MFDSNGCATISGTYANDSDSDSEYADSFGISDSIGAGHNSYESSTVSNRDSVAGADRYGSTDSNTYGFGFAIANSYRHRGSDSDRESFCFPVATANADHRAITWSNCDSSGTGSRASL